MADFAGVAMPELGGPGVDWFDAVHLLPRAGLSFGVIVTQTSQRIDLFNAYRDSVFLTGYADPAPASVDVPDLPSLPYELTAFSSLRDPASVALTVLGIQVTAFSTTQAQFDTTLTFTFDVGVLGLDVDGIRVGLAVPEPDDEVREKLSWSTDVIPKSAGKNEQRIARRDNPRQTFEVALILDGAQRRLWANSMFGAQSAPFAFPVWHERLLTTVAISVSGTTATFLSTSYADFRVGGLAVLFSSDTVYDVLQIATVTGTTITFTSGTVNGYAVGTIVAPARLCTVDPQMRSRRPPYQVETFDVLYEVLDNDTGAAAGDTSGWSTYQGRVLVDDPNILDSDMSGTMQRDVIVLDNPAGQVYRVSRWDRSKHGSQLSFTPKTRATLWKLRTLLIALRGMQTSFWLPTHHDDLIATQTLTISTSTLVVQNCGYTRYVNAVIGRRDLRITFTDGTVALRRITTAVETSATEETLTVDSAWLATKTAAQVTRIEFMELVRLDSDDVELKHVEIGRASARVPIGAVIES